MISYFEYILRKPRYLGSNGIQKGLNGIQKGSSPFCLEIESIDLESPFLSPFCPFFSDSGRAGEILLVADKGIRGDLLDRLVYNRIRIDLKQIGRT